MPDLHPGNCRWLITARGPAGEAVPHNVTAFVGEPIYDQVRETFAGRLAPGWTLDATEADAEHAALLEARARYDVEFEAWMLGCGGLGPAVPHPGNPSDWRTDR